MDIPTRLQALWNGGYGVWIGVEESEAIVARGDYTALDLAMELQPAPRAIYVKFGGDWGGLWGTDSDYATIRATYPAVIPYMYCLPLHAQAYPALAGSLYRAGYPMVVADVEFEWDGSENLLATMLDNWDLTSNLMGLCGLAWFDGYPNWQAFSSAVNGRDLVYMPMAYLASLTKLPKGETPVSHTRAWLQRVVPDCYESIIIDARSLGADDATNEFFTGGIGGSIWYLNDLDTGKWTSQLSHPDVTPDTVTLPSAEVIQINSNLGQIISWVDGMRTTTDADGNVLHVGMKAALMDALHQTRHLTQGE